MHSILNAMQIGRWVVLALCLQLASLAVADDGYFTVVIVDPYIELHTGPGRGYPITYVIDRGEHVEVLKQRTDWFKVRDQAGHVGWVRRAQLAQTLTLAGEPTDVDEPGFGDFSSRRWELGVLGGDFEGASVLTLYGGFAFNSNLSIELSGSQILGDFSDSLMANVNLVAQPFPEWRVSPFFTLGTGIIDTDPHVTLIQAPDRTDQLGHVGIGVRTYITRRFVLRAEYKSYVIFTSRDDNEEIQEWKAGFSVFF